MIKTSVLYNLKNSSLTRQFLLYFVLYFLIVQWGVIQHIELHHLGGMSNNCQICAIGNDMSNAVSFAPLSIPHVSPHSALQISKTLKYGYSPVLVFLARAPPLSQFNI